MRTGVRLFIEGSDLDNLQFYELAESCNAVIVAENSNWGNRYFDDPVDESTDPMEALADRYHVRPSRLRTQTSAQRVELSACRRLLRQRPRGLSSISLNGTHPLPGTSLTRKKSSMRKPSLRSVSATRNTHCPTLTGSHLKRRLEQFVAAIVQSTRRCHR